MVFRLAGRRRFQEGFISVQYRDIGFVLLFQFGESWLGRRYRFFGCFDYFLGQVGLVRDFGVFVRLRQIFQYFFVSFSSVGLSRVFLLLGQSGERMVVLSRNRVQGIGCELGIVGCVFRFVVCVVGGYKWGLYLVFCGLYGVWVVVGVIGVLGKRVCRCVV